MQSLGTYGETQKHALLKPTLTAVPSLLYPQTVLLRRKGLRGGGIKPGEASTLKEWSTWVRLGERGRREPAAKLRRIRRVSWIGSVPGGVIAEACW